MENKNHIIKNFDRLATSQSRRQVLTIAEAGLSAQNIKTAIANRVKYNPKKQLLELGGKKYYLDKFERVICIGFGLGACEAAGELQNILLDEITSGFVIDIQEQNLGNIICRVGNYLKLSQGNISSTRDMLAQLSDLTAQDIVICIVSDGGENLLCNPHDLKCEQAALIVEKLLEKGASGKESQTVRKHISKVKGGQLAKLMYPATIINLIFSSVQHDDLLSVATGPTIQDLTTLRDAEAILKKYNILEVSNLPSCKLVETPKDSKYFEKIQNVEVIFPKLALAAITNQAENLGYKVKIISDSKNELPELIKENKSNQILLGLLEHQSPSILEQQLLLVSNNYALAIVYPGGQNSLEESGIIFDQSSQIKDKLQLPEAVNQTGFFVCLKA